MNLKKFGWDKFPFIIFCVLSFVAGGINGFLGTGGGIILVLMLNHITKNNQKDNYATSLCATIVFSLISAYSYSKHDNIDYNLALKIAMPTALGGILGAFLVDKLSTRVLSVIFSILIIYSGFSLIFK